MNNHCFNCRKKQIIEGALGTDFSIYYFHQKLQDLYPICANKIKYTYVLAMLRFKLILSSPVLKATVRFPVHPLPIVRH